MSIFSRLLSTGRSAGSLLAITIGLGMLGGFITVALSRFVSRIVNAVFLESTPIFLLTHLFFYCLGLVVLRAISTWVAEFSAHRAALRIKHALRSELYKHFLTVGPAILWQANDEEGHTGEMVNTSMEGVEALGAYYSQYLPQLALAALIPLTILLYLSPHDLLTASILLLTAPLLPLFMYLVGNSAKIQTRRQWLGLSRMSAYFLDVLQGLTTLKALGRSQEQAGTIDRVSDNHRQATMNVLRVTFLSALALEMIATLSTAVVAVEIGLRLLYGHIAFEQAFFILLLAPEFYLPLRLLGLRFHTGMSGVEAAKRIFNLLDYSQGSVAEPSIPNDDDTLSLSRDPPTIWLEGISLTYPDGRIALTETSFTIPSRRVTMLVGESGTGKSTVLALLLRFLEPQNGRILVNGFPIGDISRQSWLNQIAWIPQHPYLFQDTVAANICLARPEACLEEIQVAARLAHADEFIQALPEKYATHIGERGVRLSAGQIQSLALARAFLQDAPLLLMDEPGAHLDPQTDALLCDSLLKLVQGRTVVIVSHRPHPLIEADQIVWLMDGKINHIEHKKRGIPDTHPIGLAASKEDTSNSLPGGIENQIHHPSNIDQYSISPRPSDFFRLIRMLSPFSARVALSILLGFVTVGSSMGLMSTAAYLISRAALHPSISDLQVAIVGVRFFGLSRGIFRYLERLVTHDVTFRLLGKLRGWFYRAVEPLVPARTQHRHSGDLLQRAIGDISTLEDFYVRGIAPPIVAVLVGLVACLLLASYSPPLAVFLAILLVISGIGLSVITLILAQQPGRELVERRAYLNRALVDGIQGLADLVACGQGERHLRYIMVLSQLLGQSQTRLAVLNGFLSSIGRLLADASMLGILWLGAGQVSGGQLNGVMLGAMILLAFSCFEAFSPLPHAAQHISSCLTAAGRLFEIADSQPEAIDPADPISVPPIINLQVKDLSFSYPDMGLSHSREVLAHITLSLTPGKKVALVGPNGAGKSSLVNLLLRFWEYPPGTILLNGRDLNLYSGDGLRKMIAVLPQNPFLFSGTIWDNLRLACPQAGNIEVEQATRRASISDWINTLPDGYQTWIGEGGVKLSGGQRQRIALARTLLRCSNLLVLDEPTLHIDPATEQAVLHGILETVEQNGSALLMITHHLGGMMEWLDEILVFQNGRIVERGRHKELVSTGGLYSNMNLKATRYSP